MHSKLSPPPQWVEEWRPEEGLKQAEESRTNCGAQREEEVKKAWWAPRRLRSNHSGGRREQPEQRRRGRKVAGGTPTGSSMEAALGQEKQPEK